MGWEEPDPTIPDNFRPLSVKRFPLLGNVACGEPIFAEELHEVYVDEDDNIHADFCLTAQGDSMINARIFEGDILFIRSQPTVENGEIAVVLIDDSATVKRIYFDRENKILTLVPENPLYKPTRFQGAELDRVRILGKVLSGKYDIE
ncbi:MAG: repressor LexA [Ruminococcaceae bacterium]|nr:repressor LexA [Oscillospiraceae bacterium]